MTDAAVPLLAAGRSDTGRVRGNNEDRLYIDADRGIFMVVDGVGGHSAGEVAAEIARDIIAERLQRRVGTPEQRLREAIALANNEILRQAAASPAHAGMTCVATVGLVEGDRLTVGHVGDTRLYVIGPEGIRKLTHDHSPVGEREDAGELTELEAMRHPRRNEVFRDIGGRVRQPDAVDFIEIVATPFAAHLALVLCSDGLSDLVTMAEVERLVRRHAGRPDVTAQALVDAANEAGGKDNVTVVCVEGARFAALASGRDDDSKVFTPKRTSSRTAWLATGVLAGLAAGFALVWWLGLGGPLAGERARTLIVGGTQAGHFETIASALETARPRDVVRVEPGEYSEAVVLPPGVDLVARTPGSVTLSALPGHDDWVSLTVTGSLGNRVTGIRIRGADAAPIAVGLRLLGHDLAVDDITVEGDVALGADVQDDGSIAVRSSRFIGLRGPSLRLGPGTKAEVRQNLFERGRGGAVALDVASGSEPTLLDNVFVGFSEADFVRTDPGRAADRMTHELLRQNYLVPAGSHGR